MPATPGSSRESSPVDSCRPHRVTLLHQNAEVAENLALLLGCLGARAQVVGEPAELTRAVEAFQPTLVLLDPGFPFLRQGNAVQPIRQHPAFVNRKLVALTGWGRQTKHFSPCATLFDAVLERPLALATLRELLASL